MLIIFSSCSTSKPITTRTTSLNSYEVFENPSYSEREETTFSSLMFYGSIIPSSYIGYKIVHDNFPGKQNELLGGFAGIIAGGITWSISNWVTTAIFGPRKKGIPKNEIEALEWLTKYNKKNKKDLLLVSYEDNLLTTLSKKMGNSFLANTFDDYKNYIRLFPSNSHTPIVFNSALSYLDRNEVLEIMEISPNNYCLEIAQEELLKKSSTVNECGEIASEYPRIYELADEKAASLVTNFTEAKNYKTFFKESKYTSAMILRLTPKFTRLSLPGLIALFPKCQAVDKAKIKYIRSSPDFEEVVLAIERYPNFKSIGDMYLASYTNTFKEKEIYVKTYPDGSQAALYVNQLNVEKQRIIDEQELRLLKIKQKKEYQILTQQMITSIDDRVMRIDEFQKANPDSDYKYKLYAFQNRLFQVSRIGIPLDQRLTFINKLLEECELNELEEVISRFEVDYLKSEISNLGNPQAFYFADKWLEIISDNPFSYEIDEMRRRLFRTVFTLKKDIGYGFEKKMYRLQ